MCAHLGLKPQSVHKVGGFRVQGREEAAAEQMMRDALALESAGADIVLLECIPAALGAAITRSCTCRSSASAPGPDTDGQILVLYDVLDITAGPQAEVLEELHGRRTTARWKRSRPTCRP